MHYPAYSIPMKSNEYEIPTVAPRVRDLPADLRPREVMAQAGAEHVSDDMILAILLRSGTRGANAIEIARTMLNKYRSLNGLATASVEELADFKGVGKVKAQVLKAALDLHRRMAIEHPVETPCVRTPGDAVDLVRPRVKTLTCETFWVLLLNAKNRLIGEPRSISSGILDASLVHPREVFREAIQASCAAVILLHNHPSGDPQPSAEDLRITRQLVEAGRIVGIRVLDHLVIGRPGAGRENDFISLRETGMIPFDQQA